MIYFTPKGRQQADPYRLEAPEPMQERVSEVVIDGYNLIHKRTRLSRGEVLAPLREELAHELARYARETGTAVTVVYDGRSPYGDSDSATAIRTVFTSRGKSADRWIIDYVKSLNTRAKMVTIVTSDDEIRRYCKAFGARCMTSESFRLRLGSRQDKPACGHAGSAGQEDSGKELSEREVAAWKRLFTSGRQP